MRPPVQELIETAKENLEPAERLPWLQASLEAALMEQTLAMVESSSSFIFGGGAGGRVLAEDPRFDDGELWNEVGFGLNRRNLGFHPSGQQDLDSARAIGRFLAQNNGFAMGAHAARKSYIVGTGLRWRLVPNDPDTEDKELTAKGERAITAFVKANDWNQVSPENVERADRDGEYLLELFPNASGPLIVTHLEPEFLLNPPGADAETNIFMGVETSPANVTQVLAYHVNMMGSVVRIPAFQDLGFGGLPLTIPRILHHKQNVDKNSRRGWPTMWGIRKNLFRAHKLMRNAGNVAALQNAIALIRKHETSNRAQVDAVVNQNASALLINNATGRTTRIQDTPPIGSGGSLVIDQGPGVKFEAPIHSNNGDTVVKIIQAELREVASRLQMSESVFTAKADANFASELLAEAPMTKNFESLQAHHGRSEEKVFEAALKNEVAMGQLSARILTDYTLQAEFPSLVVRNKMAEAQTNQFLNDMGAKSITTIQLESGLDPQVEEKNFAREGGPAVSMRGPTNPEGMPPEMDDSERNQNREPTGIASGLGRDS